MLAWLTLGACCCLQFAAATAEVRIAVASNFAIAGNDVADAFTRDTGQHITLVPGSTGKHYAQIIHGAPFDVFLAADEVRPARLEQEGIALAGSRFTYAVGTLVIWSPVPGDSRSPVDPLTVIPANGHIAMANEKLAPYGVAAKQFLVGQGTWDRLQPHLVRGENIGQALQFVRSGNAQAGLLAKSQVQALGGTMIEVSADQYTPIVQQAVLLSGDAVARSFLDYLKAGKARSIITSHGYSVIDDQ
jgi:molybdate transport system substrate-binding protein